MCGIFAYLGKKPIASTLIEGLKKLEYRGYDSAGLAYFKNREKIVCQKKAGRIAKLEAEIPSLRLNLLKVKPSKDPTFNVGIAHTRWATHGVPTDKNAHPHFGCRKRIFLVHNGIIENYRPLKEELLKDGHRFTSETDTEVLAHLLEEILYPKRPNLKAKPSKLKLEGAVLKALRMVQGAYGLAIISSDDPEKIVLARLGSPLVLGIGQEEYLAASDPSALLSHTRKVIFLEDGEIATITQDGYKVFSSARRRLKKEVNHLEWEEERVKRGQFSSFFEKEIFEQPQALRDSLRGRILLKEGSAKLGGLEMVRERVKNINRFIIIACGTASYAGLLGKYFFEHLAKVETQVEVASEWRYREPVFKKDVALLAVSQSGETADTLAAVKIAKSNGLLTLGVVNAVGSSIARETEAGVYNHVGPEISVASTKAFISQVAVLNLIALFLGREKGTLSLKEGRELVKELETTPEKIKTILQQAHEVKKIAEKYKEAQSFFYLGRRYSFPVALEGAIKLKELSYRHAEGYPAGEMKHGPLAMIDKNFPTVFIIPKDSVYEKSLSNLEEIKARGGKVLAVATEGDKRILDLADETIFVPKASEPLSPILTTIPLQLFAFYLSSALGRDIDKPRNLAKSVTVE